MARYLIFGDNDRAGDLQTIEAALQMMDHYKADGICVGDLGPLVCQNPKILSKTNRKVLVVPGNWDSVSGFNEITKLDNVIDLHENVVGTFTGYGGSEEIPPYEGANPRDWYCRELDENSFFKLMLQAKKQGVDKLVTHKPPQETVDFGWVYPTTDGSIRPGRRGDPGVVEVRNGSPQIRYAVDDILKPRFVASGHFHYPIGSYNKQGDLIQHNYPAAITTNGKVLRKGDKTKSTETAVLNPGPLFQGMFALINDDPIEKEITYLGHIKLG